MSRTVEFELGFFTPGTKRAVEARQEDLRRAARRRKEALCAIWAEEAKLRAEKEQIRRLERQKERQKERQRKREERPELDRRLKRRFALMRHKK